MGVLAGSRWVRYSPISRLTGIRQLWCRGLAEPMVTIRGRLKEKGTTPIRAAIRMLAACWVLHSFRLYTNTPFRPELP
ncbi:unnamed protein product, partial [marine sediment metagenome]